MQTELPEEGDLVLATIKKVTDHGAYVTLDEYNGITGFLHISEIATGWVRNIERIIRVNQKIVLKVIRVNKARREVDLSLKQVSEEENRIKLMEVKKENKAKSFFTIIKEELNYSNEDMEKYIEEIKKEYELLYDVFEDAAKEGLKALEDINIPDDMKNAIVEISNNIKMPYVEVRGIMEITCPKPNGIEIIKKALLSINEESDKAKIDIAYIGSPRYRIMIKAENFKMAEKVLTKSVEKIKGIIVKNNGTFNFIREESKKGML